MANLGLFDPTTVQPADDISPLPDGYYPVGIEESEWKQAKSGGEYLELTLRVTDGAYRGRKVWARLNLRNANPTAVQIAQRELSAICQATHVTHAIRDSSELHNRPFEAKVVFVPARDGYSAKNDVKAFRALTAGGPPPSPVPALAPRPGGMNWGSPAPPPAPPQLHAVPTPPAAPVAPPWAANQ